MDIKLIDKIINGSRAEVSIRREKGEFNKKTKLYGTLPEICCLTTELLKHVALRFANNDREEAKSILAVIYKDALELIDSEEE